MIEIVIYAATMVVVGLFVWRRVSGPRPDAPDAPLADKEDDDSAVR